MRGLLLVGQCDPVRATANRPRTENMVSDRYCKRTLQPSSHQVDLKTRFSIRPFCKQGTVGVSR